MRVNLRTYGEQWWQRLAPREKVLFALTVAAALSAMLYQFGYVPLERANRQLLADVSVTEKEILEITVKIADIQTRSDEIKSGKTSIIGKELFNEKNAVLLLDDVSGEARRLGVNLVSIHPSKEIDKNTHKEIAMHLDLKARYREVSEYFKRLEDLARVVNIRKLRMEACPDAASVCSVQIEAVTYMAK
jgi:type IV pilus assembly protein PilO